MSQPQPPVSVQFEHQTVFKDYLSQPDYQSLGNEGWELVTVYESVAPGSSPTPKQFEGRSFVFKRQKQ